MVKNVFGEEVDESKPSMVYLVPTDERLDKDEGEGANALVTDPILGEEDDDLDGWKPGDPV